jgi:hypothetical protein
VLVEERGDAGVVRGRRGGESGDLGESGLDVIV